MGLLDSLGGFVSSALGIGNQVLPFAQMGSQINSAQDAARMQDEINKQNLQIAREQMTFEGDQAQKQMDFQERMSDTSVQRRADDLKAAGWNPILAATDGATTPGGAMAAGHGATMVNPKADLPNQINSAARAFLELQSGAQSIKTAMSSQMLNEANARLVDTKAQVEAQELESAKSGAYIASADAAQRKRIADIEASKYGQGLNWVSHTVDKLGTALVGAAGYGLAKSATRRFSSAVSAVPYFDNDGRPVKTYRLRRED